MKLMHLSDLHIGKRVNGFSMIEDQRYILTQILKIADREKLDGVLIAGDVYDKTVPPVEAVQVFDWFLTSLADRGLPVFIIGGNHDSAERLSFGSELMAGRRVYITGIYEGKAGKAALWDEYGEVCIYLLPYLKPAMVRHGLEKAGKAESLPDITTGQEAVKAAVDAIDVDTEKRNLLIAHQFVTGASRCESEETTVGGLDQVDVSVFDPFDYVALGHLHSPQKAGRETVRYCGTPLKYSFSEAEQQKSVTLVELREKGDITVRTVPLTPMRDMRQIRGEYLQVTARDFYEGTHTEDYLRIILTDEEDIPDGMQKLRVIYPNLMRLDYDNRRTREEQAVEPGSSLRERSELEIFEDFYQIQNNSPFSETQRNLVQKLLLELRETEERK